MGKAVEHHPNTKELTPEDREVIRLYTDPLLPTFGNKSKSLAAVGKSTNPYFFDRVAVVEEIERIQADRSRAGQQVEKYIGRYAMDAARALVDQLHLGADLSVQDPHEIDDMERADLVVKANRVAIQARREQREAAELILRYHLGHPEQRHRHISDGQDPLDLGQLTNEELDTLGQLVGELLDERKGAAPGEGDGPQVLEAEWEDD